MSPPPGARGAAIGRALVPIVGSAILGTYLLVAGPMLITAFGSVADASPGWLLVGLASTAGSMIIFALLRRQTLTVAGARVSLPQAPAVSYGAGAVHTTLPAGALFSTTYAFRHLRAAGASAAAATWSLTITGLVSAITLSTMGLLGLALDTGGSALEPVLKIFGALLIFVGLVQLTRHIAGLARPARRPPTGNNRLRRRVASWSKIIDKLSEVADDLRRIHPSGRDWVIGLALALLNWTLDLGCLAACCAAVGVHVSLGTLLITYTAGMAAGSLLPVPAGLGAVEAAMTVALTVAGADGSPALAAVLLFRLLSTGSVLLIGWVVIAAQQIHPTPADQDTPTGLVQRRIRGADARDHRRFTVSAPRRRGGQQLTASSLAARPGISRAGLRDLGEKYATGGVARRARNASKSAPSRTGKTCPWVGRSVDLAGQRGGVHEADARTCNDDRPSRRASDMLRHQIDSELNVQVCSQSDLPSARKSACSQD